MNLCTNAFQAMRETGGLLFVELDLVPTGSGDIPALLVPGSWVRLRVRDNGPGIAPEASKHIFEPYFTTKRDLGGTGLGLSVVHGLASGYGGTVTVQSAMGQGSTFEVWLPVAEAPQPVDPVEGASTPRGHERILVVDDEETVRTVGSRMLTALGYNVRTATNAQEVLDLLGQDPTAFDLVLTDQTMPKMTGLALAERLRKLRPSVKIVLMSGFSEAIQGRSASQLGVDALLAKPFTAVDIATAIRAACDAKPPVAGK
jgi:CheY-like chemotaxis protein